jgi:hypothetical protein
MPAVCLAETRGHPAPAACARKVAVGAILAFAITRSPSFLNLQVAGWVLMLTGTVGALIPRRGNGWLRRSVVVEDDDVEPAEGGVATETVVTSAAEPLAGAAPDDPGSAGCWFRVGCSVPARSRAAGRRGEAGDHRRVTAMTGVAGT